PYIKQFQAILGLRDEGRMAEAVAMSRKFVERAPLIKEGWHLVASAALQMGDLTTAIKAARLYVLDDEEDGSRKMFLAGILADSPEGNEAPDLANKNVGAYSDVADLNFLAGLLNANAGRFDEAAGHLRKAIACDPSHGRSWGYLTNLERISGDSDEFAELQKQAAIENTASSEDNVALKYALGKACHDNGLFEEAWRQFSDGAAELERLTPIDLGPMEDYVERLKSAFSKNFVASFERPGSPSERPIFIIGVPRSGAGLVERLLSSHADVRAGGEMSLVRLATLPLKNMDSAGIQGFMDGVHKASGGLMDPWKNLGDNYLALLDEFFGGAGRITDMQLGNHLFLGAIKMMLPEARVVHVSRNPLATAMSCFRVNFSQANLWSCNFDNIARFFRLHEGLMAHWKQVFPGGIYEIAYEDLVNQPEAEVAALMKYCGLTGAVDLETFYKAEGRVANASLAELRKPIHRSSLEAWKNYEKWLEPYLGLFE
ncbi:MAG: sulfotransferase, partial [Sphingomonadales bacterium]